MTEKPEKKKRANKAKNIHFVEAVKALVKELRKEKGGQVKRVGKAGRPKGETLATLAARAGRYQLVFLNIRRGREPPTYDLIKRIIATLSWDDLRIYKWAVLLVEAMSEDLGTIGIIKGLPPEASERVKAHVKDISRDIARELMKQNKELGR